MRPGARRGDVARRGTGPVNDAQMAAMEVRQEEHDRRLDRIEVALEKAVTALWEAVEALRARPQVHPIATSIIATLTTIIGVLATLVALGR